MKPFGTLRERNGMKNFGTLYGYELKKLLRRKMTWVSVLVLTVLMACFGLEHPNGGGATCSVTDWDGNTVSRFVSAVQQQELTRAGEQRISGQVMDELFFERVRAAAEGNGRYQIQELFDLYSFFYLIDSSYIGPYEMIAYDAQLDPKETTAVHFYEARQAQLALQWADLSEDDAAYWQSMEAQVEKPFVYRAMAAPVLLMVVEAWLRFGGQAAAYLPNQLFNANLPLRNVHLVRFLGGTWNNLQFGYLLYGGLAAALLLLCWPGWRRWSRG